MSVLLSFACGRSNTLAADAANDVECTQTPYAATVALAEASGAALVQMRGAQRLVILSDSGNRGAYAAIDRDTGSLIKSGSLPLGATSDDLEGAVTLNGDYLAVTSAGWIYRWRFDDALDEFVAVAPPYPLAPVDGTIPLDGGLGDTLPPAGSGLVCAATGVNCGRNFESICLPPLINNASNACVGLVASKADGNVYCLTIQNDLLRIDGYRRFEVGTPGAIADCSIDEKNRAWVGANSYRRGRVFVITGWENLPAVPTVQFTDEATVGFPEGIFVDNREVFRFSDNGSAGPSEMAKFVCRVP